MPGSLRYQFTDRKSVRSRFGNRGVVTVPGERLRVLSRVESHNVSNQENWNSIVASQTKIDIHEFRHINRAHVSVEMGHVNTGCQGGIDLSPQFGFDGFRDSTAADRGYVGSEVPEFIGESSRTRRGREWPPAIRLFFAGERQMHTDVEGTIVSSHLRRFREPRTGHHDGTCAACSDRRELGKGGVSAVGHRDVVSMNHNQPATEH